MLHRRGVFVTIEEPLLTHCYHPKSTVHIRVESNPWLRTLYSMSLDQCIMNDSVSIVIISYSVFHCPANPLCSAWSSLLLPLDPWPPLIFFFTVSIIWPWPGYQTVGIIQYVAFSDWLLSRTFLCHDFLVLWILLHCHYLRSIFAKWGLGDLTHSEALAYMFTRSSLQLPVQCFPVTTTCVGEGCRGHFVPPRGQLGALSAQVGSGRGYF